MAMGDAGIVNVTSEMMRSALTAISDYRTKTDSYHTQLTETVNGLIPGNFSGDAADGFKYFYTNKIEDELFENGLKKLVDALEDIADGILKALPADEGLDDKLGEANKQENKQ
jgi:uncharacterized protein YukE